MDTSKTDTLFGGREIVVTHEDGTLETVRVSQLRLANYEAGFKCFDDEFAITALICGKDSAWIQTLSPESYEALSAAAREVNAKGFFSFAERKYNSVIQRLRAMPDHILDKAAAISSPSSPRPRPRPA